MYSKKFALSCSLWIVWFGLSGLLAACGNEASPTTRPAAAPTSAARPTTTAAPPPTTTPTGPTASILALTVALTPYITPLPQEQQPEITSAPSTGQAVGCYFSGSIATLPPLSQQIQQSRDIVQAKVMNIGPLTWNTADGKIPPSDQCAPQNDQYSSVEITIKESYKGQLTLNSTLILWLSGAPGSYKQGNYDYFPKNGDDLIFFLGEEQNLRRDNTANPMITRIVRAIYRAQPVGSLKWVSQRTLTPFTLEWLKAVIKDPSIEPTPTPFPPPPTPYLQAGQTIQPTRYYGLDKSVQVTIKLLDRNPPQGGNEKPGSERFNRLVKAFDQPLKVTRLITDYPNSNSSIVFGFELADHTIVSFVYYPQTNTLLHQLTDFQSRIELTTPPELKSIFGL